MANLLMVGNNAVFYLAMLAAILTTLVSGLVAMRICRRMGLMDIPGTAPHKKHATPIPYAGGIALALSLLVLVPFSGLTDYPSFAGLLLAAGVIFIFDLLDDLYNLKALLKFSGQIIASLIVIRFGIYIQIFESPSFIIHGSGQIYIALNYALTILWLIGITNAFNLIDSMDGLTVGLSGSAFGFFILGALVAGQVNVALFSALMLGICLGLLYYNAPPARLFLGDSGAQSLGFFLAVIAILYNPLHRPQSSSWFLPILLVGVPIFDTTLVVISRLRRGKPFYVGGLDHSYHRLVTLGWDSNRAVLLLNLVALVLDCIAFIAIQLSPFAANLIFAGCLLAGLAALIYLERTPSQV